MPRWARRHCFVKMFDGEKQIARTSKSWSLWKIFKMLFGRGAQHIEILFKFKSDFGVFGENEPCCKHFPCAP